MQYIFIPEQVRFDRRLSPMAMMVFGEIFRLCLENGGSTYVRNEELAALYGRDVQTVSAYVRQLCRLGHLRSEQVGIRRRLSVGTEVWRKCRTG